MMMTKSDMRKINGYNGGLGLIKSSLLLLFLLTGCKQDCVKCEYIHQSLATGVTVTEAYRFSIEVGENSSKYNYSKIHKGVDHYYEVFGKGDSLRLEDEVNVEYFAVLIGEKYYHVDNDSLCVRCYWPNNVDFLAEDLLIFFNENFGAFLLKFTSSVSELTFFEKERYNIDHLIDLVKKDSMFYYVMGREIEEPPKL